MTIPAMPPKVRQRLEVFFADRFDAGDVAPGLAQANSDWDKLHGHKPIIAYRGLVVPTTWLETIRPTPGLDLGSWWATYKSMSAGYALSGDKARFDDSRWAKLEGEERRGILIEANFPITSLNVPRTLMMHYLYRGVRPFTFRGSEAYLRDGGVGTVRSLTVGGAPLPDHHLIGAEFAVKLEPGSDRIIAEYVIHDR